MEIRQLGGALREGGRDVGAVSALAGEYALFALGVPFEDALRPAITAAVDRLEALFSSCRSGRYMNFTERRVEPSAMFPPETVERLRKLKAEYDPENVFRANHPLEFGTT